MGHGYACMCQIEVSIEAATARMAFLAPRRVRRRWNYACRWQFLTRTADQGGPHQGRFEPGTSAAHPGLRRLPALSSLYEHMQAHDNRRAGVAKRLMSMPISATIDLTTIDGIDVSAALKVLSEIGPDRRASQCQALLFVAGAMPGGQDFRGRGPVRQVQALQQPGSPGAQACGCGVADQPVGAQSLLSPPVCADGQGQGRDRRPQVVPDHSCPVDQRTSLCRPRRGLLRATLPAARPAPPKAQGSADGIWPSAADDGASSVKHMRSFGYLWCVS